MRCCALPKLSAPAGLVVVEAPNGVAPERVPVTEWLAHQKRFAHLHGVQVEEIQRRVEADWDVLVARCA